ncbi:hypothetical protein D3C73_1085910 [compost metagenome]
MRDAQAHLVSGAKRAHRHDITTTEDGGRTVRLGEDLLHGAISGFRLKIALDNPVVRHFNQRFFHRLHKARQPSGAGVTLHRPWDHTNLAMTAFNQITACHITAFKGVIYDRIGKIGFGFAPIHHHHRNMAIFFEHGKQRFRVFRTHHQQTIYALLRHHGEVGLLLLEAVPRVAQNQRIAFLEAVLLNGFDDFRKVGGFAAGSQQANRFSVIHLQTACHRAWGIM